MALLEEDEEKKKQQTISPAQPVNPTPAPTPTAPQPGIMSTGTTKTTSVASIGAPTPRQPQRKGTGFTNLNRIMQANVGNQLGQSVAGGISGQVQNLQSGIKQSQQQFTQQAEKTRLDTPEAAAQRQSVLDRFNESKVQPDESQFQISSGLQTQYDTQKAALEQQQKDAAARIATERGSLQNKLSALQKELQGLGPIAAGLQGIGKLRRKQQLEEGIAAAKNLLGVYNTAASGQEKAITDKIAALESQFGEMSAAEKNAWIQAERDRLVAENLPTDLEMEAFRKYQTGAYAGPTELQDFQSLLGKSQQVEDLGSLARSPGGRQELLKQFVGGRDYTQGQRTMDEALLGQSSPSLLSKAAKKAFGAEKDVTQANQLAAAQAQDYVNKARQFGEETRGLIQSTRDPLSQRIDEQMQSLQQQEATRQQDFQTIQNILSGQDAATKGYGADARMGLAIQAAQDAGYLSQGDVDALLGQGGLVQRGRALGLDINKLIGERLSSTNALGIDRRAAATADQEARIAALDKLMGKSGTDVEFGTGEEQYQAGRTKLDTANLADYIAKTEAERMKSDAGFAGKMQQQNLTPLEQILAGGQQSLGAVMDNPVNMLTATGLVGVPGLDAMLGMDLLTKGDATARLGEGAINIGSGLTRLEASAPTLALKQLEKLGIKSPELSRLIDAYDKATSGVITGGENLLKTQTEGLRDLTQGGRIDQAIAKLSGFDAAKDITTNIGKTAGKAISDVGRTLSTAIGGGDTGNWAARDYSTIDVSTGKAAKIGSFANKSSQEILRQMLSQGQIERLGSTAKKSKTGGDIMNELLKYYKAALAREGKA